MVVGPRGQPGDLCAASRLLHMTTCSSGSCIRGGEMESWGTSLCARGRGGTRQCLCSVEWTPSGFADHTAVNTLRSSNSYDIVSMDSDSYSKPDETMVDREKLTRDRNGGKCRKGEIRKNPRAKKPRNQPAGLSMLEGINMITKEKLITLNLRKRVFTSVVCVIL